MNKLSNWSKLMKNIKISPQFSEDPISAKTAFLKYGFHVECGIWSDTECGKIIETGEKYRGTVVNSPMIFYSLAPILQSFLYTLHFHLAAKY